jgi:hypothetical protein
MCETAQDILFKRSLHDSGLQIFIPWFGLQALSPYIHDFAKLTKLKKWITDEGYSRIPASLWILGHTTILTLILVLKLYPSHSKY